MNNEGKEIDDKMLLFTYINSALIYEALKMPLFSIDMYNIVKYRH